MPILEITFEDTMAVLKGTPLFKPLSKALEATYPLSGSSEPFSLPGAVNHMQQIRAEIARQRPDLVALQLPYSPDDNQIGHTQRLIKWRDDHAPKRPLRGKMVAEKLTFTLPASALN